MNDIMLDLETMGTRPNAPIIAIGACYFDPMSGEIGEKFYQQASLKSAMQGGAVVDAETIIWWMGQSKQAQEKFKGNNEASDLYLALQNFARFAEAPVDVRMWGKGPDFDCAILAEAYKRHAMPVPWKFYKTQCVRTIEELGERIGMFRDASKFKGIAHYALDDAINQAKNVSQIYQMLVMPYQN